MLLLHSLRGSPGRQSATNAWAVAAAVSVLFVIGLAAVPIAMADSCDNARLRAQNNSTALPDCRAYEMVSSPYKEGFTADPRAFTDDGIVSYGSTGSFAGNAGSSSSSVYHAERSAAGWATTALAPSDVTYETFGETVSVEAADLRSSLWVMRRRDPPEVDSDIYLRNPGGEFVRVGEGATTDSADNLFYPAPGVKGASADLSHVVFSYGSSPFASMLREYVGTGNGGLPRLVSVDNDGNATSGEACYRNISEDGRVVIFGSDCAGSGIPRLWARVAGSATVAVSGSECGRASGDPGGVCNDPSAAVYEGSADDGSRVFFTTSQQLVNGDVDQTRDLYACDIPPGVLAPVGSANPCASLTEVSGTASGAQVGNVSVVSDDGSRVYFVAAGAALADNLGTNGAAPVAGQPNLYVWTKDAAHPGGEVRFVAKLDTDDLGDVARAQMTPDGRYLIFLTSTALVTSGPGDDDDEGARDVYRYDSVTGSVVRVSTSVAGAGGNDPAHGVGLGGGINGLLASVTPDGASVVFDTAEALSPSDTDGTTDVYVWRDGQVSLISNGGGSVLWISPSGRDVFFLTDVALVAGDRDVIADIYSARVGGGFDQSQPAPCSGDGCQGLLSAAPGLAGPRSGLSGDSAFGDAAAVLSLRAVSAAQRRRLAATGKVSLTVKANVSGRVSATARAKIAGRSVTVGSERRTMTTPGSLAVTLKLSRKARGQLAARGRLTVRVSVSHSKASKGRSVTLKLTRARAKKSSVGGRS